MRAFELGLAGFLACVTTSCGQSPGPASSEALSDAIIQPVQTGKRGPMLCVDSIAVHVNDAPWEKSLRVWSTTDHERIVEIVGAVRMQVDRSGHAQDDFVTARDDMRIFFVCRAERVFASVRVIQARDTSMNWHIRDGIAGSVWEDRGGLREVMRRFGIARAAGIE